MADRSTSPYLLHFLHMAFFCLFPLWPSHCARYVVDCTSPFSLSKIFTSHLTWEISQTLSQLDHSLHIQLLGPWHLLISRSNLHSEQLLVPSQLPAFPSSFSMPTFPLEPVGVSPPFGTSVSSPFVTVPCSRWLVVLFCRFLLS